MPCANCSVQFTIVTWKRSCHDCTQKFCSKCLAAKCRLGYRRCGKCQILSNRHVNRSQLMGFTVKELRRYLNRNNVTTTNCKEKQDLVELVLSFHGSSTYIQEQEEHNKHVILLKQKRQRDEILMSGNVQSSIPSTSSESNPLSLGMGGLTEEDNATGANTPVYNTASDVTHAAVHVREEPIATTDVAPPASTTSGGVDPHSSSREHMPSTDDAPPPVTTSTGSELTERLRQRQAEEMRSAMASMMDDDPNEVETRKPKERAKLEHIDKKEDIGQLTVVQLREILVVNFVDHKGCVEKWELVERVERLWQSDKRNKEAMAVMKDNDDEMICKICMDAKIDCVLLECGHMVTCSQCGKRVSECPICRQYVVRAVHVFSS